MPSYTRNIQDMYRYSGGKCPLIQEIYKICIGTVAANDLIQEIYKICIGTVAANDL